MAGRAPSAKVANNSNRGSAPGERRGGRQKGVPNKATRSIREISRQYTDQAINALVDVLSNDEEPAAARVAAANSLLDRGYGKAATIVQGDEDGGALQVNIVRLADADG